MTDRQTQLRDSGERALRLIQRPAVGSRWTPQHVVRQDSASGFFEEVNAPSSRLSADAVALQAALLTPVKPSRWPIVVKALCVLLLFGLMGAMLGVGGRDWP